MRYIFKLGWDILETPHTYGHPHLSFASHNLHQLMSEFLLRRPFHFLLSLTLPTPLRFSSVRLLSFPTSALTPFFPLIILLSTHVFLFIYTVKPVGPEVPLHPLFCVKCPFYRFIYERVMMLGGADYRGHSPLLL